MCVIYIFDLYFYVLLLVFSVCTRGLRAMQFQFSVCMYGTCGRIDIADFEICWNDCSDHLFHDMDTLISLFTSLKHIQRYDLM